MKRELDAVVVGAGLTGVLVAERLWKAGVKTALLEAGPRPTPGRPIKEPDRRAWPFRVVNGAYDWFRIRAVGGRTHLWGGWCHRLSRAALHRAGWPLELAELEPYYTEAEQRLNVVEGVLDARYRDAARELDLTIVPKRGARSRSDTPWTPAGSLGARRARTHQQVVALEHSGERARGVVVFDHRTARTYRLDPRLIILAASPIETARILLNSKLGRRRRGIGHGLTDHAVASWVLIERAPPPTKAENETRGPFPGMAVVEPFVNIGPDTERPYPGSFSLELTGPVPLRALDLERLAGRDDEGQLRATMIHALGEVFPHPRRRVALDRELRDLAGVRAPRIMAARSRADRRLAEDMRQACVQFADAIALPESRLIRFADPLVTTAGHEVGTCAVGADAEAPTHPTGYLRALPNVWIADGAALPTAGDRHPTLTIAAWALRVADHAMASLPHPRP